jgi:hypothetical protein
MASRRGAPRSFPDESTAREHADDVAVAPCGRRSSALASRAHSPKRTAGPSAEGEAEALLMILKQRGLVIADEQQRQITTCTDLAILDPWPARALSVTSVDELLA